MARNHSDAQPNRALTNAEWESLHELIQGERKVSVETLCKRWGVSKARYYQRYPVAVKTNEIAPDSPQQIAGA